MAFLINKHRFKKPAFLPLGKNTFPDKIGKIHMAFNPVLEFDPDLKAGQRSNLVNF